MKLKSSMRAAVLASLILLILENGVNVCCADGPKLIAEKFCESEFLGADNIRLELAKFTPEREAKEKGKDSTFVGRVISWDGDPLFVVASYRIISLEIKGSSAIATSEYVRLARTVDEGVIQREIIPDYVVHDKVELYLIHEDGRWWILDPPTPRISIGAIIEFYQRKLGRLGPDWLSRKDVSDEQKLAYRKLQEDLGLILGLKRAP